MITQVLDLRTRVRCLLRSVLKGLVLMPALCFLSVMAEGQTNPATADGGAAKLPAYEVVSVKPAQADCGGMSVGVSAGRFTARCVTLWGLLFNAYQVKSMHDYPPGLPGWGDNAKFDIDAKMDDATAAGWSKLTNEEQGKLYDQMLQSLLADRFSLRVHHETREMPIYALVVAKDGSKLKPWPADKPPLGSSWGASRIRVQGGPMGQLVFCLADTLSRTVVDQTGLTGSYDIELIWTPDEQQGTPDAGPTIFTALEEQLGLRVKPDKGPVQVLVVDHAERPSEN
jgi:uncharacterized protein (TIGR03435 family)